MQFLNGKKIAGEIRRELKEKISRLKTKPGLAVILVGDDPASHLYVSLKERACLETGIFFEKFLFPAEVSEGELLKKVGELNKRSNIHGILVQLPLPQQDTNRIIAAIDPNKDVDGFHLENLRRLEAGEKCLISPVVLGVRRLVEETHEVLVEKKAVLVMSKIFARPFVAVLSKLGLEVTVVSPEAAGLSEETKKSDLLITAVGQPNLISASMIKPGAIVIDIGTTRVGEKVVGDVNRAEAEKVVAYLTPVPGGVGPMTVALLLSNVVLAANKDNQLEEGQGSCSFQ
jgi:methylenetetrahydrofolate dehydrogenase (NADP+)/methenyltetrahydrofolate cyclohydrolase